MHCLRSITTFLQLVITVVATVARRWAATTPPSGDGSYGENLTVSCRPLAVAAGLLCLAVTAQAEDAVTLEGHENVVSSVVFSNDGQRLISGSWDRTVRVWNATSGQQETVLRGHSDWVFDLKATADNGLISTSQKEILRWSGKAFDMSRGRSGHGGAMVNSAAFSSDGTRLATGGRDGFVRVWPVGTDSESVIELGGFRSWVGAVCISADGSRLAAGTRTGTIRIFELPTGKQLHSFDAHPGRQILTLAISPDGKTLASGAFEQTARLWSIETGKETAALSGHRGVVTSAVWPADGKLLATGERHGSIHIWDAGDSSKPLKKIMAHSDGRLGFSVTALAFSPDGQRIASGSYDKTIRIWHVADE